MAKLVMIIGKPTRNVGIKKPYATNSKHPIELIIRKFFKSFIVNEINTANDAKYPTHSVPVIPSNSILLFFVGVLGLGVLGLGFWALGCSERYLKTYQLINL